MINKRISIFILLIFFMAFIYLFRPFIYGLGCNFSFVAESEHIKQVGKCKAGILTTYYEMPGLGASSYNRYLYGVDGDFIYAFRIKKERIDRKGNIDTVLTKLGDHPHAMNFYDGDRIYILKYKCVSAEKCFMMRDDAMENIYEIKFHGRVGLF
ncbi:hypothetical protein [Aeromonas hydrophila]|uniref:hypothetical protein n=1 Tax=Aeromonas hydrophila TaxID=644 RepID=UPI0009711AD4|nr:hypothetical protein [Aeromonas hydrophila]